MRKAERSRARARPSVRAARLTGPVGIPITAMKTTRTIPAWRAVHGTSGDGSRRLSLLSTKNGPRLSRPAFMKPDAAARFLDIAEHILDAVAGLLEANRLLLARVERLEAGRIREADPVDAEHQRWLLERVEAAAEERCRMVEEGR